MNTNSRTIRSHSGEKHTHSVQVKNILMVLQELVVLAQVQRHCKIPKYVEPGTLQYLDYYA